MSRFAKEGLRRDELRQQELCDRWADVPLGTLVIVERDDGSRVPTKTRSAPWLLGDQPARGIRGHTAVIKVEGIAGGYSLDRITRQPAIFSCGCSHLKVAAGMCDLFDELGRERSEVRA